jgi:flagellar hook-basal body complex protein FliE
MIGSISPVSFAATAAGLRSSGATQPAGAGAADFTAMLANVANEAIDKTRSAEATALRGVRGDASVEQVVSSIMAAERSLQTALAVRDKLAQAYLELSRMGI